MDGTSQGIGASREEKSNSSGGGGEKEGGRGLGMQRLDRHFSELGPRKSLIGNEPKENPLSPGRQEPKGRKGAYVSEPQIRAQTGLVSELCHHPDGNPIPIQLSLPTPPSQPPATTNLFSVSVDFRVLESS